MRNYGTKYSKEKITITNEEIDLYKCDYNFDYPPENKFCPQNLDILPAVENAPKYPEKINDSKIIIKKLCCKSKLNDI